jgi:hypothetical protein
VPENADQPSLPTRHQLARLRDFLHGRAYAAGAIAIRLDGEPPHPEGSPIADAGHAAQALYVVVNVLSRRVLDAVYSGRSGDAARDAWGSLLVMAHEWRESPDMPEELKELVGVYFPR